ncbi:hypothetical protein [Haloarcula salinisoli]|uniref:DUF7827 domain-containing protein n=1 Tax=Haloarcula salinisoli TaxID=2487746 RepID=A0A8J7YBY4_9EURY|nr:hypothetical protein [Halomicroarcula salinisoli]MBX0302617.1 hypothetical protein [Halomicroarcula salinisoli]
MVPQRLALLTCSVVLLATVTAGPGMATVDSDTDVDDPPTKNLCSVAGDGDTERGVGVEDAQTNETLGDVVELPVSVAENGTATVHVTGPGDLEYRRQVTVTDTSGDGEIRLSLNTFAASRANWTGPAYTVGANDTVTVTRSVGDQLTAGRYDISVYANTTANGTVTDGEPTYATEMALAEPTDGRLSVAVARSNASDTLDTRQDLERARARGQLGTVTDSVATGDTVVLSLRVDGLEGVLATAQGANDTARFSGMLARTNTSLRIEGRGFCRPPPKISLNEDTIDAVIADTRNDTFHVVVNTAGAGVTPATNDRIDEGDELGVMFTIDGETRVDVEEAFEIDGPEAELLTDARATHDSDTATVRGETNLAPGSDVVVRLAADGTTLSSASATVGPERQFDATLAVGAARRTDSTTLTVLHNGTAIETISDRTVLSVPSNQSITDGTLEVPSFWHPDDIYPFNAYIHVIGPDGSVVGRSGRLHEGEFHNVTISLSISELGPSESLVVVPAEDESIDPESVSYDNAFLIDGPPAGMRVNITTVSADEASAPNETTTEPSATPSEEETSTVPSGTDTRTGTATGTETTAADGAGFGVLATLVAGLLALVAGTRRRR